MVVFPTFPYSHPFPPPPPPRRRAIQADRLGPFITYLLVELGQREARAGGKVGVFIPPPPPPVCCYSAVSPFSTAPPPPHSFLTSLWTSGWEKLPAPARPWTPQQPVLVPRAPLANLRVASDHTACSGTLGHCRPLPTGPHPYSGNHDNGPNSEPQNPHSRPPTTGRDPGFVNPPLHPKPGALRGSGA